ncbi:hypothetical protein Cgig2_033075 [Carnegiea gigantea]|uniref:Uncharacterized protein n=1 Tax=Carnegiea gigantea TaxID=171969 RepID=A0A9Q1JEJ4_9CARY|nr:hypothetical protein Cgig2_016208 [Carnegiea gigantea]KAJ8421097.1 hypothetical protein Cgig2_033075 [Carnegiea gigantea]
MKTKAGKDKYEEAAPSTHPETPTSSNKSQQDEKTLTKTPTKSEKKQRGEKSEETKKERPKKKAFHMRQSQRVQNLSKPLVQQGHISEVEISYDTSDDKENSATETPTQRKMGKVRRNKEVGGEEETSRREAIAKGARLTKVYNTTARRKQPFKQKDAQLSAGDALLEEKTNSAREGFKMACRQFDPYSASFVLSDGQRFMVIAFDAYVTLGVPIGGREIMESSRSSTDKEYDEMHAAWVKEWKIKHTALG